MKVYSLEMLGKGNKKVGTQQHQKARLEVLQRLRRAADVSPEQTSQWEYFKTIWDVEMSEALGADWAELFEEMVQLVLNDLAGGRSNTLSVFMHNETERVFCRKSCIRHYWSLPSFGFAMAPRWRRGAGQLVFRHGSAVAERGGAVTLAPAVTDALS